MTDRDVMEYDVAIVGGGPAGLACAIRLKQLAPERSVCLLEKGSEIGAHSLSGAVIEPAPLDALLPGWRENPPGICVPAGQDEFLLLTRRRATKRRWRTCSPKSTSWSSTTASTSRGIGAPLPCSNRSK